MLGNDVLLNFVRAREYRDFAVVEIVQRTKALTAFAHCRISPVRQRVITGGFHVQGIDGLYDLGALDLQER